MDLILGGHIHLPYVMPILADRPTAGWVAQAGTTCSWRVRGKVPNSVNLIVRDEVDGYPHAMSSVGTTPPAPMLSSR